MADKYIIIGRESCPFCNFAVDFCSAKYFESTFLDYEKNREILEDYKTYYDIATVPIILKNNTETGLVSFVGGYTDLLESFS